MFRRLIDWATGGDGERTEAGLPADPQERAAVIREVGRQTSAPGEAVEAVPEALHDDAAVVRAAAAAVMGSEQAYIRVAPPGPLVDALEDDDREVRLAAARAFEIRADEGILDDIYDLVFDEDVGVRAAAALALTNAMQGVAYELDGEQVESLVDCFAETAPDHGFESSADRDLAREQLLGALARGSFVSGLQFLDAERTTVLVDALGSESPGVRANAARVLGRIDRPDVVGPLLDALDDEAPAVREGAVDGLERAATGDDGHVKGLDDPTTGALSDGIDADDRVVEALRAALDRETDPDVVDSLITSLGRLGDPAAVPTLTDYVDSDDEDRRRTVVGALADLAPAAVEPLRDRLRTDPEANVRAQAANGLGDPGAGAFDELRRAYETDDGPAVRAAALSGLKHCQADWAVDVLVDGLADDSPRVRKNAILSLAHRGATNARDEVAALAENDPRDDVRNRAAEALERL